MMMKSRLTFKSIQSTRMKKKNNDKNRMKCLLKEKITNEIILPSFVQRRGTRTHNKERLFSCLYRGWMHFTAASKKTYSGNNARYRLCTLINSIHCSLWARHFQFHHDVTFSIQPLKGKYRIRRHLLLLLLNSR